jgi:hypothetical protein
MKYLVVALSLAVSTSAIAQTPPTASAQSTRQQERVDAILNTLFGDRTGQTSLDTQWSIGRLPLSQQRAQYEARIDADIRSGGLSASAGDRAKSDYRAIVDLEARYGADRRFTPQERADLNARYTRLTQLVAEGGYSGGVSGGRSVAEERGEFERRVDNAVRARQITRTQATQLKSDYASLVRLEDSYMRDGALSVRERDDLETRLDGLDERVGDMPVASTRPRDSSARLDAIAKALPASGLPSSGQTQLRVEHEDLTRLAAAYRRSNPTPEELSYLDRRLSDLERRARVRW